MAEIMLSELNSEAKQDPEGLIARAEQLYSDCIKNVAKYVNSHKDIRLILIAGPSGSGKTTTANLICDAIKATGESSIVVSLDNFYLRFSDKSYPLKENGERDFECPEALYIDEIQETMRKIAYGKSFTLPKYEFKTGDRTEETEYSPMPDGCVIIEGLHALNPKIAEVLPHNKVFKIFISVSTNINENGERILSGRKIRFMRRLVRDSIYRSLGCERTLNIWRHVLNSEDLYLYPYKKSADLAFNTFHSFELGVMKPYVENLISEDIAKKDDYANTVLNAIKKTVPINEELVPETSLIKEFIPGGIYEDLY